MIKNLALAEWEVGRRVLKKCTPIVKYIKEFGTHCVGSQLRWLKKGSPIFKCIIIIKYTLYLYIWYV